MILLNYKSNFYKYIIYSAITLIILFLFVNFFYTEPLKIKSSIIKSNINYEDENTIINVEYPRFKNDTIDKIISNYVYDYVKNFKSNKEFKKLYIDYNLYYYDKYVNIVFNIKDSLNILNNHKNIIINLENKNIAYISNLFDKKFIEKEINELVYYKYSSDIFDSIKLSNINNHTYIINDNEILVYFYDISFNDINYIPFIKIKLNENVTTDNLINNYKYDKFIAFTYDDGPSKYTEELLKTLELNNSTATFFMLGNRMKYNKDTVLKVYNSKNEVSSHTYSHKNLTKISKSDALKEINSTQIIYNEITGDDIKYIRPPYGSYNEYIASLGYPLILWNIDPKDWLYKDSVKVYNHIIKNACDGCIVLLHDIHKETIEATKKVLPTLNSIGYNVVSIKELIKVKNYKIKDNEIIRKIK